MSSDRPGDTEGGLALTLVESSVSEVCVAEWIVISLSLSYCLLLGMATQRLHKQVGQSSDDS